MGKTELIEREKLFESQGKFQECVCPPNTRYNKVGDDYDYFRTSTFKRITDKIVSILLRFIGIFIGGYCGFKIRGKANLKQIKRSGAILTSNHINNIDCVLIKKAVGARRLKITVAEFNNFGGFLGKLLRAGGILPIGSSPTAKMNMSKAIDYHLKKDLVLFYPEEALWWCYEKPRPLKRGAFFYAAKNSVPVLPLFFTFKTKRIDKKGIPVKKMILNIGKPIYPDTSLSFKEQVMDLQNKVFKFNKNTYENFYGKKLEYDIVGDYEIKADAN